MQVVRAARAFDGARFVDDGVTVLVDGDKIVGVEGPHHEPPEGSEVATYDGTLLPGLIDTHVHLVADATIGGLESAPDLDDDALDAVIDEMLLRQVRHGVTTVRDLGDVRYRTLAARDEQRPGRPRLQCAGPPLTVPGGHCHFLGGAVVGVEGVMAAVRERAERGADVVKVMASGGMLTPDSDIMGVQFSPEELAAAVRAGHDVGLPVVAHAHSLAGVRHALDAGVDGIEHFTCLTDAGMTASESLLRQVADAGVVVCPTAGTDVTKLPPFDTLPPRLRDLIDALGIQEDGSPRGRVELLRRAREHGVAVVNGTDAGVTPSKDHGNAWLAVLQLIDSGYPLAEALVTATSYAARVLGLEAETGGLTPGLSADLLVTDGDLRSDPDVLARPAGVWVRGEQVPLD
ncbi:MAG: amidohydrolase family protein [Nocardioides sp.]